jgi:hypothetical protein
MIHGGCRGADQLADRVAADLGYRRQVFVPDWDAWPGQPWKAAYQRNQTMIDLGRPHMAFGFKDHFDYRLCRGDSEDTYRRCLAAGIPVTVIDHFAVVMPVWTPI